jgi:hypothetical protein
MRLNIETGEVTQLSTIKSQQGQWGAWTCYMSAAEAYNAALQLAERTATNTATNQVTK